MHCSKFSDTDQQKVTHGTTNQQRTVGETSPSNIKHDYLRHFCSFRRRRIVTFTYACQI